MIDREQPLTASRAGNQWQMIGVHHHHGVNIPLFSLHSKESAGIGEYLDLLPMVDWLASFGGDVLQLLPLNDTGTDKSPYNALSAFALNPIHISLSKLPALEKYPSLQEKLKELQKMTQEDPIPHDNVRLKKEAFLKEYWQNEFENISHTTPFIQFLDNHAWVKDYALFRALKDKNGGIYWRDWPQEEHALSEEKFQILFSKYQKECSYYEFIQYLCHIQLNTVKVYAESKKVFLMGDLPILISPDSCDVWRYPHFFDMNYTAGAPPDMYSEEGQNWGFPLYNWPEMINTRYIWWQKRLLVASFYYQIFRIDHVVGFFRIWGVPPGKSAKEGRFIPEDEAKWIPQGKEIMEVMLDACLMLPIGEDLGVVPTNVRTTLRELGICGTKVMRWERVWNEDSRFIPVQEYIPESLTTVSTHDSETLVLWWKNNPQEAKDFAKFKNWEYSPNLSHDQLYDILYTSHHSGSLFHVNLLQEYFSLFKELVNEDPEKERVNLPGIMNETNWCYRFKPSVEEILAHKELTSVMHSLTCI